jgi:hypothetical protein
VKIAYVGSMGEAVLVDGRVVKRGDPFEVDEDLGGRLLEQTENYQPVEAEAKPAARKGR